MTSTDNMAKEAVAAGQIEKMVGLSERKELIWQAASRRLLEEHGVREPGRQALCAHFAEGIFILTDVLPTPAGASPTDSKGEASLVFSKNGQLVTIYQGERGPLEGLLLAAGFKNSLLELNNWVNNLVHQQALHTS